MILATRSSNSWRKGRLIPLPPGITKTLHELGTLLSTGLLFTSQMDMSLSKLWETTEGHGGLACCSSWGHKESVMTWQRTTAAMTLGGTVYYHIWLTGEEAEAQRT